MNAQQLIHPTRQKLRDFVLGRLGDDERSVIEQHVSTCPQCLDTVRDVSKDQLVKQPRDADTQNSLDTCGDMPEAGDAEVATLDFRHSSHAGQQGAEKGAIPQSFGRYKILKVLGRGGMGAVYLGEDPHLDRRVAIKVPFFAGADRQKVLDRFQREAKSIAAIQHPNICPIYEVGEVDGSPFMAMAFVKGKPLSQFDQAGQATSHPPGVVACAQDRIGFRGGSQARHNSPRPEAR